METLIRHLKNVKNNIFFFVYLILNPKLFVPLFKGINLPTFIHFKWIAKYKISTLIDVGCYKGDVIDAASYINKGITVYGFEANRKSFNSLTSKYKVAKNIILINNAIGDKNKIVDFYENKYPQGSSVLPIDKKIINKYNLNCMNKSSKNIVQMTTLDAYFNDKKLKQQILLKIDTQGNEYEVILGAKKLLRKVSIVHIESWYQDKIYKKQHLFNEICQLLAASGFIYIGDIRESEFYPIFEPHHRENSLFINPKMLNKGIKH